VIEGFDDSISSRFYKVMVAAIIVGVLLSFSFGSWRVTTGLILGGLLSLLNFHWLQTSIAAAFSQLEKGSRPRIRIARYVLRYLVVGILVYAGYKTDVVSLTATMIGLSSFVVALFAEALRETFLIITRREEIH
jgi:hypothetical protein